MVKNDALAIATVMTCTLSVDHRVVDGALGAEWLRDVQEHRRGPVEPAAVEGRPSTLPKVSWPDCVRASSTPRADLYRPAPCKRQITTDWIPSGLTATIKSNFQALGRRLIVSSR